MSPTGRPSRNGWHPAFQLGARLAILCGLVAGARPARANSAAQYLECLTNFESYAESIWHPATFAGAPLDAGYWGDGGSSGNGGIRGNSGVAVAYATLVIAQPNHPQNSNRLARLRQALNYDTATHVTGTNHCVDGQQWGWSSASSTDWQTPLWSGSMGLACLLVQTNLPAATVSNVQRVVVSEADHRAAIAPASGYISDTKAEENAWQGNIVALAAAWLSDHPHGSNWLYAAKRYCANSYTVAALAGDPLAAWISTVTLYPSFALQNHGFYHPTYEMVAGMSCGDSWLMARLANPGIAAQLLPFAEHNVLAVWTNNLNALVMDSGDFAYPAGLDWELHDFEQNSFMAWMAAHFNDPLARWADDQLANCVRYRQIVNGNGAFVGPSGGGFYREAVEARRTAIAWLHWSGADFPIGPTNAPGPALLKNDDVQVIQQRSAFGSFSISYNNARILAVIEPAAANVPTNAFLASPRLPGILGLGALGNPTAAQLISFVATNGGFSAELKLTHGLSGTTEVYLKGTGETFALVEVPWPAVGATTSTAGSFSCGIENDPLCGGTRRLEWAGGAAFVTNRSGASFNITNAWICVDGRYGLAAGPEGFLRYQAASGYNRLGAAEDTLQFFPSQPYAPRYAVWFPTKTATQTALATGQIAWSTNGTNATLTFPGAGGAMEQIQAPISAAATDYPPYAVAASSVAASSAQSSYPPLNAVDGDAGTFWVSGNGPTNHAEWLRVNFSRSVAVSGFLVAPRTENGGYGPRVIQVILNVTNSIPPSGIPTSGSNVFSGIMSPTAMLEAQLANPVYATNAVLVVTDSYDRGSTNNPRNTQVVEFDCFERAKPGTYGDWAIRRFSAVQLTNAAMGAPQADSDGDGVPNILEYISGGDPLVADAATVAVQLLPTGPGAFKLRFRERKFLTDVSREFQMSTNFEDWISVVPSELGSVQDLGEVQLWEATFATSAAGGFYRIAYRP